MKAHVEVLLAVIVAASWTSDHAQALPLDFLLDHSVGVKTASGDLISALQDNLPCIAASGLMPPGPLPLGSNTDGQLTMGPVTVYEVEPGGLGPNVNMYGGAAQHLPPSLPGTTNYLLIDTRALVKAIHTPNLGCTSVFSLILHELNHVWAFNYFIALCEAATDPQACQDCYQDAEACMKEHSANGKNDLEESRADFVAYLCLCKRACEAAAAGDSEKAMKLEEQAAARFKKADDQWKSGKDTWDEHCAENHANCGIPGPFGFPLAPLNPWDYPPSGGLVEYEGPRDDQGNAIGAIVDADGDFVSCDCTYTPPDFDPCEGLEDA